VMIFASRDEILPAPSEEWPWLASHTRRFLSQGSVARMCQRRLEGTRRLV
jgi:hypothetical protein